MLEAERVVYMTAPHPGPETLVRLPDRVASEAEATAAVRRHQVAEDVGTLVTALRAALKRLRPLSASGWPQADRLRDEAQRLLEVVESLRDRDRDQVGKSARAVRDLLELVDAEERRRADAKPRMATLAQISPERLEIDRRDAGEALDAEAQRYMAAHGCGYQAAFWAVCADPRHRELIDCYSGSREHRAAIERARCYAQGA
jgi:hypothetical protein